MDIQLQDLSTKKFQQNNGEIKVNNKRISLLCAVASLSGLIIGFEVGTADNFISSQFFVAKFGVQPDLLLGVIMSCFNLGCIIGCVSCLRLKRFKFNNVLKFGYFIYTFAAILNLINWSVNFQVLWLLVCYRITCGVSGGICLLMCPVYVTKLTLDDSIRGINLSLFQLCLCTGILLGNILNLFMNPFSIQLLLNLVVVLVSIPTYWVLPSIITQEPNSDRIMKFFLGSDNFHQLDQTYISQTVTSFKWKKLVIGVTLMAFQQLTGINFFFYYAKQLIPTNALILVLSIVNFIGSVLTMGIIDKFKRLTLLRVGAGVIATLLLIYYFVRHFSIIYLIVLTFSMSWGPISGIISNEIANLNLSILTASLLSSLVMNFLIINMTPIVMTAISLNILFIFFAAMVIVQLVIFFVPETSQLSMSEIEAIFCDP